MEKKIPSFVCGPNIMVRRGPRPKRMNPVDPSKEDPRPRPPCSNSPCFACLPPDLQSARKNWPLKLRQLEDCYACRVSDACHRRKKNFYYRWQTHLDRMKPLPGYDYKVYCCDNYVDLSENKDFIKHSYFKPNLQGQRLRARKNYLWPRVLSQALGELEQDREHYASTEVCPDKCAERNLWEDLRTQQVKQIRLYNEEGYSFWHQQQLRPFGFVETATLMKNRIHPFKKDASFSTPLQEICTGREPPFKEFRDLKLL